MTADNNLPNIKPIMSAKDEGIAEGYLSECEAEVKRLRATLDEVQIQEERRVAAARMEVARLRAALVEINNEARSLEYAQSIARAAVAER